MYNALKSMSSEERYRHDILTSNGVVKDLKSTTYIYLDGLLMLKY